MMKVALSLAFVQLLEAGPCIPILEPLQRPCARLSDFSLPGYKALVITTSHDRLGPSNCTDCKPTGVALTEASVPYYEFKDAGMSVDVASIQGGKIPDDGGRITHWDCRLISDAEAFAKFQNSLKVSAVNFTSYDIIWMAGGFGASWDLGLSAELGKGLTKAFAAGKFLGSVCHGALGFIMAKKPDGSLLVNGTRMTGVPNKQLKQLGQLDEPMHPEDELLKRGALFEAHYGIIQPTTSDVVVDDITSNGSIITGENQNSACGVSQAIMSRIESDLDEKYAWVPENCQANTQPCYEGLYSVLSAVSKVDILNPCKGSTATIKKGTCASFGFDTHKSTPFGTIEQDPIFRKTTLWFKADALVV